MPQKPIRSHSRRMMMAGLLLGSATALSGCGLLVLGGAATTAAVVTDRRSAGEQLDDEAIELKAGSEMRTLVGNQGRVAATAYAGLVLLTGDVPSEQHKQRAAETVSRIPKVKRVVNELRVGAPTELSVRTNDTWISSKVRGNLINTKEVPSRTMVVQTERGVVYMLGKVTAAEAERAAKVAAGVPGVSKVVKLFDIVSPASLSDSATAPAPISTGSASAPAAAPGATVHDGPQAMPVR